MDYTAEKDGGNFNSHTREGVTKQIAKRYTGKNFNSHTREGVTLRQV